MEGRELARFGLEGSMDLEEGQIRLGSDVVSANLSDALERLGLLDGLKKLRFKGGRLSGTATITRPSCRP